MRKIFADACYWIALASKHDELHDKAKNVSKTLGQFQYVTADEVLNEFLTFFRKHLELRLTALKMVRAILNDPNTIVIRQTHNSFLQGLQFYEKRPDKQYSLTDCISMVIMEREGLTEVLTEDHHFEQAGFTILLK